jgi:ATP-dependent Lhr-like helicase
MESENLLAAVFPDQLACLENIVGDREVPDHPLVKQTIEDCLTEAMDIEGLEALLRRLEKGEIDCRALDLPEPSLLAHEILNARPYAFLDDAPLEERRTQAVYTRRAGSSSDGDGLGVLDAAAIDKVCEEAWPQARNADELHEALLLLGVMSVDEARRCSEDAPALLASLEAEHRAASMTQPLPFLVAAERLSLVRTVYPELQTKTALAPVPADTKRSWERADALRELVRGRMEVIGPVTGSALGAIFSVPDAEIEAALLALEAEGFILRGRFHPGAPKLEWCDRRLLARIHRLTLNRLRAEIQPVTLEDFQRFLLAWQRVDEEHRAEGPEGVKVVLDLLDGMELAAGAWEPEVLALRVKDYQPQWLDQLCLTGRVGWGRMSPPQNPNGRGLAPLRSTPIAVFDRENLPAWLGLSNPAPAADFTPDTELVLKTLAQSGAMFFAELVRASKLLPSRAADALGELAARGWVTADSFEGLRALLMPSEKRVPFADADRKRRHRAVTSVEFAGRWALLRPFSPGANPPPEAQGPASEAAVEAFARVLLRRYGIVFRRLLERESLRASWYDLCRFYRRLEARGEIRGGHFVNGASGEQFALPEAIGLLRSIRKSAAASEFVVMNATDPLNLLGILTSGPRLTAISANRILLRDGRPIAALNAGEVQTFNGDCHLPASDLHHKLTIGSIAPALRPYYA